MDYAIQPPLTQRINFRLIAFLAIAAIPFIWFTSVFLHTMATGGIQHANGYDKVDLKSLGQFPFDDHSGKLENIPAKWRALDGKRVQLEGFMFAGNSAASRVGQCEFVYNIQVCCFGGPPQVQERVFLYPENGDSLAFIDGFTRVTGVLHVKLDRDSSGKIASVYTLAVEKAESIG